MDDIKKMSDMLALKFKVQPSMLERFRVEKEKYTHYQDLVDEAAKICNQNWYVMHMRIERGFPLMMSPDDILFYLSQWIHRANKAENKPLEFNYQFKVFRENNAPKRESA